MKKILLYLGAFALTVSGLVSCADDYEEYDTSWFLENDETMTLEASAASIELDEDLLEEPALTFTWTPAREVSDEYILTYVTMLDLKTNSFGSSTVIREVVDDGVFSKTYTTEELQNYIVDKWVRPTSDITTLSFKVIAKWEGGSKYIMPEVRTVDVDVLPYRPNVFEADKVELDGDAVRQIMPSMTYTMSITPENEFVYAGEFKMAAGKMTIPVEQDGTTLYICPADGESINVPDNDMVDGKPAPTEAYKAKVMDIPDSGDPNELPAWNLPSDGDWRVIIDMENETVQFYSPKNKLDILTMDFQYENKDLWIMTKVFEPGPYYIRTGTSWDNWIGKAYDFAASLIDPQILVWDGKGSTIDVPAGEKFCIKTGQKPAEYQIEPGPSTQSGGNPTTDKAADFGGRILAIIPEGGADVPYESGQWLPMELAVSNVGWTHDEVVKLSKIEIDLRNKRVRFF